MELTILGSGTGVPTKKRGASGYLLRVQECRILFDSGPGTIGKLAQIGVGLHELDAVFYTHFHPDHSLELGAIIFALMNPSFDGEIESLRVVGPPGLRRFYEGLKGLYGGWVTPSSYRLHLEEVAPTGDEIQVGPVRISAWKMVHNDESQGYRVTGPGGESLAYTGDTDIGPDLIKLARGVDVLVCESSHPDGHHVAGHLTPRRAGRVAREAGCARLVLTHFYPDCEGRDLVAQCRKEFEGEIVLAEDLMTISI
jgi:ribonuclease BN (tRNA processing enzyme)